MLTTLTGGNAALMFTNAEVSELVSTLPPRFGRLTNAGRFAPQPSRSQFVKIEREGASLRILPQTPGGKPASLEPPGKRDAIILEVPNISRQVTITPDAIRGMLAAGQPDTMLNMVNRELDRLRRQYDITREYMRTGALKGIILDGRGDTIWNLFTVFGITQKVVEFDLDVATTDVKAKCAEVIGHIEDNMNDDVMTDVECEVSETFFDKLVDHAKVKEYYLAAEQAREMANIRLGVDGGYRPREFRFGNILFRENRVKATNWGGATTAFVEADTGYAAPVGTMNTEEAWVAPPLDIRELDGQPGSVENLIHITQEILKHGEGLEVKGQLNELPVHKRPAALVKINA
jgi:hypothetical protein